MGRLAALIACGLGLARGAVADDLTATASESIGDGRTAVPVAIVGNPKSGGKDLPVGDIAIVNCTGAASLAAPPSGLPAVLAPAVSVATTMDCTAQLRGVDAKFALKLQPPQASGLYAAVTAPLRTTDAQRDIDVFAWDGKRESAPAALRAAASDADVATVRGKLIVTSRGKAPRLLAIAFTDGTRVGATFVPVIGVTTLPVESEAQSNVEVWVSGRWFGPVPTDGKLAQVPIEVPPGVTRAVTRSTSSKGYITDELTDLKIPPRPRIAAIATSSNVSIGGRTTIGIALASADGRPALPTARLVGKAERGTLGTPVSRGGGLWTVEYTAPATAGDDAVVVRVDGDDTAGTAKLALLVVGGAPSRIEVALAEAAYEPGATVSGIIHVFDASANEVHADIHATLDGAPVDVTGSGELEAKLPEKLPIAGVVPLEVTVGSLRKRVELRPTAPAASAAIEVISADQTLLVDVRDRFGNLAQPGTFELTVTRGKLGPLMRGEAYRVVVAGAGSEVGHAIVRANGQVLADASFQFESTAFGLGAWASGGFVDNLGVLTAPRGSVGLSVRRSCGSTELALQLGVEVLVSSASESVEVDGVMRDAERAVQSVGVPALLRARWPVGKRTSASVSAGIVPARVHVKVDVDEQTTFILGARALLAGDYQVGPGNVVLAAAFGRAKLDAAIAGGQLDGMALTLGYEWWFGALGR